MRLFAVIACSAIVLATVSPAHAVVAGRDWGAGAYVTSAYSDTLSAAATPARTAALRALEHDRWLLAGEGCPNDSVLTEWKSIDTPLVRVLIGKITARCLVTLESLDDERTIVTIRGAMMTKHDITQSPAFPTAQRAWGRTARKYLRDVRGLIEPGTEAAVR